MDRIEAEPGPLEIDDEGAVDSDVAIPEDDLLDRLDRAVDTDADGVITAREVIEASERVARTRLTPSYFTLPAACLELVASALTLHHASGAEDMQPVVFATAFVLNLFLLAAFHYLAATTRSLLLWLFMAWKGLFALLVAAALYERSIPHKVWTGEGFRLTEPSSALVTAAAILVVTTAGLVVFRLVLSTTRWWARKRGGVHA